MVDSVTVIIRTVGRPSLSRALNSLQGQGVPQLKVCVVDAAGQGVSLDAYPGTFGAALQSEGLNLEVINHQVPMSRAVAAQAGLDAVRQGYALFLDDDDELLPGHLSKLLQALRESPSAVAAYTGVVQMCEQTQEVLASWDRAIEPWQLLAANALPIHSVMFDAARVHQAGVAFDPALDVFEDWDFWLQVQAVGPMVHVPGISARYWVSASPQSQSDAQAAQHGDSRYARVWQKWWSRVPEAWRHELLRAGRDEPILRLQWAQAEQARSASERARLLAEQAQLQTEQARQQSEQARLESEAARLHTQQALDQVERSLSLIRERLELTQSQRDEARVAEQGVRLHLQAVLASRSWKLMAPFRWWGRQARRVLSLRHADARRNLWWRLRYRSYPRPALVAAVFPDPYQRWIQRQEQHRDTDRQEAEAELSAWSDPPLLSVIMPVYNPPAAFWDEAIESLQAQWYVNWELCIADDASTDPTLAARLQAWAQRDPRIRYTRLEHNGHISAASNAAISLARGEWLVLLDQDDLLHEQALWRIAQAVRQFPEAGVVYSDEDKVDERGQRFGPYFKPAFDLDLLRGQNMISHLGAYRTQLVREVGGFRVGYEGSQDHDLVLRCIERLRPDQVVHIPRVLYHWRVHQNSTASGQDAKPYALDAGLRAVQDHLNRSGLHAHVQPHPAIPHHQVLHGPAAASVPVLHILLWGGQPPLPTQAELVQRLGLREQGIELEGLAFEPTWAEAQTRLKAWSHHAPSQTVLVLWAPLLKGELTANAAGLRALVAHVMEPAVGAVSWALREPTTGGLHDAGWLRLADGRLQPVSRGMGRDTNGYYGHLCLAHRVSALQAAAVLVRPQALDREAAGLCLQPGFRAVWSPVLEWSGPEIGWLSSMAWPRHTDSSHAPMVLEAMSSHLPTAHQGDPAYSPHLCAVHADHRMAEAEGLPPSSSLLQARVRQ